MKAAGSAAKWAAVEAAVAVYKAALKMGQEALTVPAGTVPLGMGGIQMKRAGRAREAGSVKVARVRLAVGMGVPWKRVKGKADRMLWGQAAAMGAVLG